MGLKVNDGITKDQFVKYLAEHPDERFWQAVRNWSGQLFILASQDPDAIDFEDTFYWESRNGE